MALAKPASVCLICTRQFAKYNCPRCNLAYCCVDCFKKHGEQCTTKFYQEQVAEQLKQQRSTSAEREQMLEALKREQEQKTAEAFGSAPDTDGLAALASVPESELSADKLTAEQRADFAQALRDGRLSSLIQPWRAWWDPPALQTDQGEAVPPAADEPRRPASLVAEVGARWPDDAKALDSAGAPPLPTQDNGQALPPLSELLKTPPSPLLINDAVDVLYCYCLMMRLYNGEPAADLPEAIRMITRTSRALAPPPPAPTQAAVEAKSSPQPHRSVEAALEHVVEQTRQPDVALRLPRSFAVSVIRDTAQILFFRPLVLRALGHLHALVAQQAAKPHASSAARVADKATKERKSTPATPATAAAPAASPSSPGLYPNLYPSSARQKLSELSISESAARVREAKDKADSKSELSELDATSPRSSGERTMVMLPDRPKRAPTAPATSRGRGRAGSKAATAKRKGPSRQGQSLSLLTRKLYFFVVWANSQPDSAFVAVADKVCSLWKEARAALQAQEPVTAGAAAIGAGAVSSTRAAVGAAAASKPLITATVS